MLDRVPHGSLVDPLTDPLLETAQRRVGTTLCKKYRIDGVIGVGGMAAVYKGQHRNGHRVAVKMLHPQLSLSQSVCARFLKEAYVANAVDHPGAVRVIDDDIAEDGAAFLVMELLEGETLATRHERSGNRLPPREVAEIAYRLLDVLATAHGKQIIHRDIKPENLFITGDGQVKVLDFGIARMSEGAGASATRTGSMMGTPAFMPPEQAMGLTRDIDARTDIWAVGATMFTVLSGAYVHETETVEQMIIFAATRPARSLATVAPQVPAPIIAVVDRALGFDRTARHPDARAMQTALGEAYLQAFGVPISATQSGFPSRPAASHPVLDPTVVDPAFASGATQAAGTEISASLRARGPMPVSTTAGVSSSAVPAQSGYGTSQASHDQPAGVPVPRRMGFLLGGVAAVGLLLGVAAVVVLGPSRSSSSGGGPAAAGLVPPPATSTLTAATAATAATAPTASVAEVTSAQSATTPLSNTARQAQPAQPHAAMPANAGAQPAVVVAPRAPAAGQPASPVQPAAQPATPPPAAAAPAKTCDPPFFIDPATGTRKVKPGC